MHDGDMRRTAALAAAAWAVLFAVPSFYWALGGDFGTGTIAADVDEALGAAAEAWIIGLTGVLKLALAALALSFLVDDLPVPRRSRVALGWLVALALGLYGIANFAGHALMLAGLDDIPPALGRTAVHWHTFFWDPYWLLGGVLFGLAVHGHGHDSRP